MTTLSPEEIEDRVERLSQLLREERMTGLDFRLHQSSDETGEYYVTEATVFCDQNARVMDLLNADGDWSDTTLALFCTAVNLAPLLIAQRASFANALTMTGCNSEEDLIDMANVGRSMMDRMAEATAEGPLKGWAPADDPAEIVTDLKNALDDALHDYGNAESECKVAVAALEEAEAAEDLANGAVQACRDACKAIMGGNASFVDDDVARALLSVKERAETAEQALSALQQENERLRGDAAMLQEILDSRPAINAALPDSYIRWSQAIYSGDAVRAALQAPHSQGGEANG